MTSIIIVVVALLMSGCSKPHPPESPTYAFTNSLSGVLDIQKPEPSGFKFIAEGVEVMEIKPDGTFLWKGRVVTKEMDVYRKFKAFLDGNSCKCAAKERQ